MEDLTKDRFLELYRTLGLTQTAFSEKLHIRRGNINYLVTGQATRVSSEIFVAIAEYLPNVNMRWLLLGEEPMFLDKVDKRRDTLLNIEEQQAKIIDLLVPLHDMFIKR